MAMTDIAEQRSLDQTAPPSGHIKPRTVAGLCIAVLSAAGWAMLAVHAAHTDLSGNFGNWLLDALCRPFLSPSATIGSTPTSALVAAALTLAMWSAMTLAMMLPTASGMVMTYAELAETAAERGHRFASPLALIAGYATVWLGFAAAATLIHLALSRMAMLSEVTGLLSGPLGGALFIVAGLYQVSAAKHTCLTRCQRPFPFFFTNWTEEPAGVYRLGLRQGLYCLGCCWAMMLLMFAVGVMNLVWMAVFGALMTLEKVDSTDRFGRGIGVALIVGGSVLVLAPSG